MPLAVAVAVIALVFTFGLRVVQVDGHSMQPTLLNGERLLMTPLKTPDYGDVVIVDSYIPYGKPLVKRVIGKCGGYHRHRLHRRYRLPQWRSPGRALYRRAYVYV